MIESGIQRRVERLWAAVHATVTKDVTTLRGRTWRTDRFVGVDFDFTGGKTPADLENELHLTNFHLAHLRDHVKAWARRRGVGAECIDARVKECRAIPIIIDLTNRDKHGGEDRAGGWSRLGPTLRNIHRQAVIRVGGGFGRRVVMRGGMDGRVSIAGDGNVTAVTTADVVDSDGNLIGDMHSLQETAVGEWQRIMREELGITL